MRTEGRNIGTVSKSHLFDSHMMCKAYVYCVYIYTHIVEYSDTEVLRHGLYWQAVDNPKHGRLTRKLTNMGLSELVNRSHDMNPAVSCSRFLSLVLLLSNQPESRLLPSSFVESIFCHKR